MAGFFACIFLVDYSGSMTENSSTSLTLLGRLRDQPDDEISWQEFVTRYGKKINDWCIGWGLQPSDADDVTQTVLLEMAKQIKSFEYRPGGRFRSWLRTIAYRVWKRYAELRERHVAGSGSDHIMEMLNSVQARDDFLQELQDECDRNLLEDAMKLVEQRVEEHTWKAFLMTALQNVPGKDVASQLGIKIGTVYVAKNKVSKMIQEEVEFLDNMDA